jgi:hypothetical protein
MSVPVVFFHGQSRQQLGVNIEHSFEKYLYFLQRLNALRPYLRVIALWVFWFGVDKDFNISLVHSLPKSKTTKMSF